MNRSYITHRRLGLQPLRIKGAWGLMCRMARAGWPRIELTLDTHQVPGLTVHETTGRQHFIPASSSTERQTVEYPPPA